MFLLRLEERACAVTNCKIKFKVGKGSTQAYCSESHGYEDKFQAMPNYEKKKVAPREARKILLGIQRDIQERYRGVEGVKVTSEPT